MFVLISKVFFFPFEGRRQSRDELGAFCTFFLIYFPFAHLCKKQQNPSPPWENAPLLGDFLVRTCLAPSGSAGTPAWATGSSPEPQPREGCSA